MFQIAETEKTKDYRNCTYHGCLINVCDVKITVPKILEIF